MIKFPINKPIFLVTSTTDIILTSIVHAGEKILKCSFAYKKILIEEEYKLPSVGWVKLTDESVIFISRSNIIGYSNVTDSILKNKYNTNINDTFIVDQNSKITNNQEELQTIGGYLC